MYSRLPLSLSHFCICLVLLDDVGGSCVLVDCSVCGRCDGHLVKTDEEIVCVACGWRGYPTTHHHRLSPRYRAQRRVRVRRVALESSARGACHTCGADAVTAKHCAHHRELNNAAARARIQSRRADRLCRYCELPAVTRDYCDSHRRRHNAQRQSRQRAGRT